MISKDPNGRTSFIEFAAGMGILLAASLIAQKCMVDKFDKESKELDKELDPNSQNNSGAENPSEGDGEKK